ncbi:MAG: pyridoxamine 5'-phosphate oxidase family protein [Alphaproteobacteria bacterium]|nr:pyridoxamine 5'-phosphate oxidase family protein [Alphaproteobacteria bacterium]
MPNTKDDILALLRNTKTGALSVIDFETKDPFVALVNVACDQAGLPFFLFSKLARHTKSLLADRRASLLVSDMPEQADALTGLRATFVGRMVRIEDSAMRHDYLIKHPYAETYIDFGDFSFWRMTPEKIFVVGGFGRIQSYDAAEIF